MKKVLIIEDLNSFSTMLAALLKQHYNFQTYQAATLSQAKSILKDNSDDIFVAIVDLHLPDSSDGGSVDLVKSYGIPVLVFTGQFDEALREDMIYKGVADYTLKEGVHNIKHVIDMTNRIYNNYSTQVLVVDDSQSSRSVMTAMLETQKYQVLLACSAAEALQVLNTNKNIRMVVTDCYMDKMDGFELTKKIRDSYSPEQIGIIGITAHGNSALSAKFIKFGADDFILKPFDQEEFLCRINHVMNNLELNQKLEELNQQKNTLLGTAAHDIRGPIGNIEICMQLIEKRLKADSSADNSKLYNLIDNQTSSVMELLNELLSSSAIENGQCQASLKLNNLGDVLNDALHFFQLSSQQKNQTIVLNKTPVHDTYLDSGRIHQCLDNLVNNAIKYSPLGSTITIECFEQGNEQIFSISDEGVGIAEDRRDKLFQPFSTLGSVPTGGEKSTGLGLFITKQIAESHGGSLNYLPVENGGSCFQLCLPMAQTPIISQRMQ